MSKHDSAFVPLESWCYNSPDVRLSGRGVDVGILCEALIYYDHLYVNVGNANFFAELFLWAQKNGCFPDLVSLIDDGAITVFDYAFQKWKFAEDQKTFGIFRPGNAYLDPESEEMLEKQPK